MLRGNQVAPEQDDERTEQIRETETEMREETENPKGSHKSGERTTTGIW
jgi:hypothetical protein